MYIPKPKNYTQAIRALPLPDVERPKRKDQDCAMIQEMSEKHAAALQRALRLRWGNNKRNILIVMAGNKVRNKDEVNFRFELHQLNINAEEERRFVDMVDEVIASIPFEIKNIFGF